MLTPTLLIIDGDGLAFHSLRETLHESLEALDEKIANMFTQTQGTHYVLFISKGKYFRHTIDENYKQSRTRVFSNPKWIKTLKAILEEKYNAQYTAYVEADDLVAYLHHNYQTALEPTLFSPNFFHRVIICSPDKDLLYNIPGTHFNYSYMLADKQDPSSLVKGWWVETTPEMAKTTFWKSLITGDASDGVKGIEGKGQVFADKLFNSLPENVDIVTVMLQEYIKRYGESTGIYQFQKNYRLLTMLKTEEDFLRETGMMPPSIAIQDIYPSEPQESTNLPNF